MEKNKIMNFKDLEAWKQAHVFAVVTYQKTKYLIPITLFLILYTFPSIPFADAAILTKPANNLGLVGYWNFNEGTSTYAGDSSANNNTGTLTNMANPPTVTSGWGNGKYGGGLNFDGTDDYVSVPDQNYFSPSVNDVTVSFWAKIETNATPGDDNICGATGDYLIAKGITGQWEWGFENDGNDRFCMTLWQSGGSNHMSIGVLRTMNDGRWHHYVGVMDYLMEYTIYVDGISVGTTGVYTGTMDNGTQPVEIGRRGIGDNAQATIDDVRVFGRALSASEVTALYKSGGARFGASSADLQQGTTLANGIVGHWTFDGKDTTNTTATDVSGQNNTGTFTNFTRATNAKAGKLGQGMNFDGVNDYVLCGSSGFPSGNSSYSFSGWVFSRNNQGKLISWGNTGSASVGVYVGISGGKFSVDHWGNDWTSTVSSPTNTWFFITVTYNGTTDKIYLNGVLSDSHNSTTLNVNFGGCYLGSYFGQAGNFFGGVIDDPRIYNRALSAEEVKQLYNLGSAKAQASSVTLQQGTTLANGLVGHWTFDGKDTTNTTATDVSGQNNTGTFTGFTRATNAKAGKLGQGMNFDGVNDYVNIGVDPKFDGASAITISAWIKPNASMNDSTIVGKSTVVANQIYFWVGHSGTATDKISWNAGPGWLEATQTLTLNEWTHVVGVADASGHKIFYNGVLISSNSSAIAISASDPQTWKIGSNGGSRHFNGSIDDVRIYNRGLSASEVKQLYLMGR